jgi:hypothetical protein
MLGLALGAVHPRSEKSVVFPELAKYNISRKTHKLTEKMSHQ